MVKYIAMMATVVIIIVISNDHLSTNALAGNSSPNTSTTKTKDDVGKDINHEIYDVYVVNIEKGLLNVREIPSIKSKIIANLRPRNCVLARKNTLTEEEGAEWVELAYLSGWAAKRYLSKSSLCEDAFSIIDDYYNSVANECDRNFSGVNMIRGHEEWATQELWDWTSSFVSSDKPLVIDCSYHCEDIACECDTVSFNKEERRYMFRCNKPVDVLYGVLKWITAGCDDRCTQGIDSCDKCDGASDEYRKCSNAYEAFLDGIRLTAFKEQDGFLLFTGGFDCCSSLALDFSRNGESYIITSVYMYLD